MSNFKIDSVSCTDYKMILIERKLRVIPEVKINEIDIAGMDGVEDGSFKFGKNNVKLTIECFDSPTSVYDDIRAFISFLNPKKGYRELVFDDEPNYVRYVRLINGSDIDYFYSQLLVFGKFELEFKMADPYTYSRAVKKYYFNGLSGATAKLINNGGAECPVKIKMYAPKGITATKVEETDGAITYSGTWSDYATSYCSGGKSKFSNAQGSYAQFTFSGSGIRVYGLKSAGKGIAKITIDNTEVSYADCYAASETWQSLIFEDLTLGSGTHTIKVEVGNTKNAQASGYQINIDYFQVVASSIPTDVLPLAVTGGTYNYDIVPSITNPKLTINKEYVKFKDTLGPSDELIIDTNERDFSFKLNGYSKLRLWEGDFPTLEEGENIIGEVDDTAKGALIIFEFRERWP